MTARSRNRPPNRQGPPSASLTSYLSEAACTFADIVELKTFHVGTLREVNSWFFDLKAPLFRAPYPAWTQLEVASLAFPEATIEIAAVACVPPTPRRES